MRLHCVIWIWEEPTCSMISSWAWDTSRDATHSQTCSTRVRCLFFQVKLSSAWFLIPFRIFFFHTRTNVRFIHITRYNIVFLAFTYGIPMVVMIICYSVMGRELWGSKSIGENTERQTESVKSKKKVSKEHLLCQYDTHVQWFFVIFFVCLCPAPSHWFFAQCHLTLVIYYIRSSSRGSTFKCDVMKRMNNNLVAKMTNIAS